MASFTTCSRFKSGSSSCCYVLTRTDLIAFFSWLTSAFRVALALVLPRFLGRWIVCYGGGASRRAVWHSLIVRTHDFDQETQSIYRYQALVAGQSEAGLGGKGRSVMGGRHLASRDRVLFASLAPVDAAFAAIDVTAFFEHTVVDPRMQLSLDTLVQIIRRTWMYRSRLLVTALSAPHLFLRRIIRLLMWRISMFMGRSMFMGHSSVFMDPFKKREVRDGFVLTIVTSDLRTLTLDAPSSVVQGWSNDMHAVESNARTLMTEPVDVGGTS